VPVDALERQVGDHPSSLAGPSDTGQSDREPGPACGWPPGDVGGPG
jgi:hypothetical protein